MESMATTEGGHRGVGDMGPPEDHGRDVVRQSWTRAS